MHLFWRYFCVDMVPWILLLLLCLCIVIQPRHWKKKERLQVTQAWAVPADHTIQDPLKATSHKITIRQLMMSDEATVVVSG